MSDRYMLSIDANTYHHDNPKHKFGGSNVSATIARPNDAFKEAMESMTAQEEAERAKDREKSSNLSAFNDEMRHMETEYLIAKMRMKF